MIRTLLYRSAVTLLLILAIFCSAPVVFAQSASGAGGGSATGLTYDCNYGGDIQNSGNCTFYDLIAALKKVLNVATIYCLAFSVVVIAYAGYKYMISGDKPGERAKANSMLQKVALGIVFVLAAWLIVTLIFSALVNSNIPNFLHN